MADIDVESIISQLTLKEKVMLTAGNSFLQGFEGTY